MRALEVLGLAEDGAHLVCHDPATGEKFTLPSDERLTSAVRGDISRLGQLEIEMESQLRPRDIQARIRAGASVAEVAAAAGTSPARIERFAYPVLMERSSIAACSATARPVGPGGPAAVSIRDAVADTLTARGHAGPVEWDAFKDADGWVMAVSWKAGRSENTALFAFHPGSGGGTVSPRNDAASDLLDPARKPLRTVRPMAQLDTGEAERNPRIVGQSDDRGRSPGVQPQVASPHHYHSSTTDPAAAPDQTAAPDQNVVDDAEAASDEQLVADTVEDERAGARPATAAQEQVARTGTDNASPRSTKRSGRSAKPAMPTWDDVLLGGGLRPR